MKRISGISRQAVTWRHMICNSAFRVLSTSARTWIHTLVIETRSISSTIGVHYTFWTTTSVRITVKIVYTYTWASTISFPTYSIWSTRWWETRMRRRFFRSWKYMDIHATQLKKNTKISKLVLYKLHATEILSNKTYLQLYYSQQTDHQNILRHRNRLADGFALCSEHWIHKSQHRDWRKCLQDTKVLMGNLDWWHIEGDKTVVRLEFLVRMRTRRAHFLCDTSNADRTEMVCTNLAQVVVFAYLLIPKSVWVIFVFYLLILYLQPEYHIS